MRSRKTVSSLMTAMHARRSGCVIRDSARCNHPHWWRWRRRPQTQGSLCVVRMGLLVLGLAAALSVSGADAQVAPSAPENLRCPGVPAPPLPGTDWKAEPVWEWREVTRVEGTVG